MSDCKLKLIYMQKPQIWSFKTLYDNVAAQRETC